MSHSDLPAPIQAFLRATELRDAETPGRTLASGAVLVDLGLEALPAVVASFVEAMNLYDLDRTLATFSEDANVNDRQRDHWGHAEVRDWLAREIIGDRVTMHVTEARVREGRCFVVAKVTGAYDKTGLPDPLTLRFYFSLAEGRITQLVILPLKAA